MARGGPVGARAARSRGRKHMALDQPGSPIYTEDDVLNPRYNWSRPLPSPEKPPRL